MEKKIVTKIHTKAVHAGDRKRTGSWVPVTTPIHTATSFFYDDVLDLDRSFEGTLSGPSAIRATVIQRMRRWRNWWRRSKAALARWPAVQGWRR